MEDSTPRYWTFKHKPATGDESVCKMYVDIAMTNNCAIMQYEYGLQNTQMVSRNWNKLIDIKEGDYIFLKGNALIYAVGKVIRPRKQSTLILNARQIIKSNNHKDYRSDNCSAIIVFNDSDVFYEDFSGPTIDEHGKWGQRIDVEEWMYYCKEGLRVSNYEYSDNNAYSAIREVKSDFAKLLIQQLKNASNGIPFKPTFNSNLPLAKEIVSNSETDEEEESYDTSSNSNQYTKKDFLQEVYMDEADYQRLVKLLLTKKNVILQGAPGVGKTFAAKRLAYSLLNEKDDRQIKFIQFHQNYSYEDFIMGYKPDEKGGFVLTNGVFYDFCLEAAQRPEKKFFFIIDEINRGNLSKIFGELLVLIETSHRNEEIRLSYSNEPFTVPNNLYIIGMMNTADRSLAMIDYALRRRFAFFDMKPAFDSNGFVKYENRLNDATFSKIISAIKDLNESIATDDSLGEGFCLGHSYFCNQNTVDKDWLKNVIEFEVLPMLKEYWFDNRERYEEEKSFLTSLL